ncbi:TlpA disulfide reductase family protein [Sphingobacterium sp.]|uniref:TlpA family protein disulfide reductase n=1 Tax=Sphingobacterium sp. TaxID=341027 RepID=UPI00289B7298|nr:TlpA disulfide reductase family protein [Sphingobacterium sp.]
MIQKFTRPRFSSAGLRRLFDSSSNLLRDCVAPSSGLLRLLFDCPSSASRSPLEAEPKPSRSVAEHVSNESRRRPETESKPGRRAKVVAIPIRLRLYFTYICQALARYSDRSYCKSTGRVLTNGAVPPSDFLLTNTLSTPYFILPSHWFCITFPLALFGSAPRKTNVSPEQHSKSGRSWSGVGRYLSGLFPATKGIIDSRFSYRECTESVLKRYWKGTKELLKRYREATKQIQAFGSFLVNFRYKLGSASEMRAKMRNTDMVSGGDGCRLKSEGLQVFCGTRVYGNEYLVVQKKTSAQKALKYFSVVAGYGKGYRMSLTCLLLMIVSMFSLSAQTPRKDSGADGLSEIKPLGIGDTIPQSLWDLKMPVYNDSKGRSSISLSDYQDNKLIIVDFWATWCTNCLESFPKLDQLKATFKNEFDVLLVNCKRTRDDQARIDKVLTKYKNSYQLNVQFPYLIGDTVFNALFPHRGLPHVVWIGNDRVVKAITYTTELQEANVRQILDGKKANLYMKDDFRYKVQDSVSSDTLKLFSSYLSKRREGIREMGVQIKERGNEKEFTFLNSSIAMRIYEYLSESGHRIDRNLWVFENNVGKEIRRKLKTPQRYIDEYCYFLRYPKDRIDFDPYRKMIHDIQDNFGVRWEIRKEVIDVWRIDSTPKVRQFKTKGQIPLEAIDALNNKKFIQNLPLRNSFHVLSWLLNKPVLLGDIENINVDFDLPADLLDHNDAQLLHLFEQLGAKITVVPQEVEYVYFSADRGI